MMLNPMAIHFAQRAQNTNLDPVKRMAAMVILSQMADSGILIGSNPVSNPVDDPKPKYVWRNGARVKVK